MTNQMLDKLMGLPMTDCGNAERLLLLFGSRWVYLPRFRSWMYYTGKCWRGRTTANAEWSAATAFENLARAYENLRPADDPEEQQRRSEMIAWLHDSHRKPTRTKIAVLLLQSLHRMAEAEQ